MTFVSLKHGGWVLLPRMYTLRAINESLRKSPQNVAIIAPWLTKDGNTLHQRHQYMLVPLDSQCRAAPMGDIVSHEGSGGILVHSLAHPFPVIWKAVKMFGENTNPIALSGTDPTHASAMLLAQMIYHQWFELAGGEKALNRQIGDDEGDEDDGDEAPSDEDTSSSKQERDEFDPSGNDEDGSEAALTEDDEAPHGDPSNTGPRRKAFDIPEDAPPLVSDSCSGEVAKPPSQPDSQKSITLWVGPLPRPFRTDSESEDEENGKCPSRLMPSESRKVLLGRWFNNDFKGAASPVSVAEARSALPAKVIDPSYEEDLPVRSKRRRALADDV